MSLRKLHIIHLDDHSLFKQGVKKFLLEKMPNILIEDFPDNDLALLYVNECFNNKKRIDLIITDFNHPRKWGCFCRKGKRT